MGHPGFEVVCPNTRKPSAGRLLDKSQFRRLVDLAKDALRAAQRPPDSIVLYNGKEAGRRSGMQY